MKKITKIFLLLGFLFVSLSLAAQSQSDMRINEFLVINTNDFEDDFGHKNGWIELFNTSYGTVNIGGCYLTNDPSNLTKYIIPKGDVLTKIAPRQHTLFGLTTNLSEELFTLISNWKTLRRFCLWHPTGRQ